MMNFKGAYMGKPQDKYNKKAYHQISVRLEKNLVEQFKAKCDAENRPIADVIRQWIKSYLN